MSPAFAKGGGQKEKITLTIVYGISGGVRHFQITSIIHQGVVKPSGDIHTAPSHRQLEDSHL